MIIEGELVIGMLDNYGKIIKTIKLSPGNNIFCRIPSKVFHVDIPIVDSVHLDLVHYYADSDAEGIVLDSLNKKANWKRKYNWNLL